MQCDDLRTSIQDYMSDYMGYPEDKTEAHAEGLMNYLSERGWKIIDACGCVVSE